MNNSEKDQTNSEEKALKKKSRWTEREEVELIVEVAEREQTLFGEIKGSGGKKIGRIRQDAWQEIVYLLNSRYVSVRREAEEVKKKYSNLKQRFKEKIDRINRAMKRTGGGPAPNDLTPVELLFWERMCSRPSVHGISAGVDTGAEVISEPSTSEKSVAEADENASVTIVPESAQVRSSKKALKRRSQQDLTFENTEKDTDRIMLEMKKLQKEMEVLDSKKAKLDTEILKLKSETESIEFQKIYYQLKIQTEFGISIFLY